MLTLAKANVSKEFVSFAYFWFALGNDWPLPF